jgi:hypothetical protein
MPRYFFHLQTEDRLFEDPDGIELPSLEAAHLEALWAGRELWAEACRAGSEMEVEALLIVDEDGRVLMSLPLADTLPQRRRRA